MNDTFNPIRKFCFACGQAVDPRAEICPYCGVRQRPVAGRKDRIAAALFAFFLGWFGAHKFYLGRTGWGLIYLLFFWTGIPAMVGFVEGIVYLLKTDEAFAEKYG